MAKMDLKHAFRLCPVRPEDWDLSGLHWDGQYYVDKRLPFGLRSSPAIFNRVADALEWTIATQCDRTHVLQYLDDFFFAEPDDSTSSEAMASFRDTARRLGVLMEPDKEVGPATTLTFLGIELD